MIEKIFDYRLGMFLILCFVLGGTSQDIVAPKLPLYGMSLLLIGWSLTALRADSHLWKLKMPVFLLASFMVIVLIYLVPLPPSIWTGLPGRGVVQQGFEVLDVKLPWLPLSLTPEATLFSLFDLLPPIAIVFIVGVLASQRELKIAIWSIVFFALFTVCLGLVQLFGITEWFYFYEFMNTKVVVGFFSNANHQASFLLMVLPLLLGLTAMKFKCTAGESAKAWLLFGVFSALLVAAGILLTGSIAGYLLLPLVALGALFFCVSRTRTTRRYRIFLAALTVLLVGGVIFDFVFGGGYLDELIAEFTVADHNSRLVIFPTTYEAAKDYFPFGSGLGSFKDIYKLYEEPGLNTIPQAHNELLQLALELGLMGLLWLGGAIVWWGRAVLRAVLSRQTSTAVKCVCLAMASILIHSLADYPLRTIGLSSLFVFYTCFVVLKWDVAGGSKRRSRRSSGAL